VAVIPMPVPAAGAARAARRRPVTPVTAAQPRVESVSVSVNEPPPLATTDVVIASPGRSVALKNTGAGPEGPTIGFRHIC
jgi:hypothetical protein